MPEDKKDSYELLLEKFQSQDERIQNLEKELKDMIEFNRALLNRTSSKEKDKSDDLDEKFEKYLKGE